MTTDREPHLTRRQWLTSAAVIGGTAVAGGSLGGILHHSQGGTTPGSTSDEPTGDVFFGHVREPFYGPHQAGITSAIQAHASYLGFTFHPHATATDVVRTLRILTHDAALLTQGKGALADTEPELAHTPARLTVTVGFGPEFFDRAGIPHLRPPHLAQLPSYRIDRLDPAYGQTDLLLLIHGDDPTSITHAARVHTRQIRSFAQRAWTQHGFSYARGTHPQGTTMRNLMGQVDGTHTAHTQAHDEHVWLRDSDGDRHVGATTFVLRRIAMTLDTWDEVDRPGREDALGRRMSNGAPLTGTAEHDPPDFEARNDRGFPVIAPYAHIRRAHHPDPTVRIYRRAYNFNDPPTPDNPHTTGLLFGSFQRSIPNQYLPIQNRLAELDALNEWTIPVGSAVYYIPPGVREGQFLGEQLLT